jgi:serine/threonine-protein kinase
MSPEQASGREIIDGRSDVYALGCVLYEMLGGVPPYAGTTPQDVMTGHLQGTIPKVRKLSRDAPAALEAVILRALAKHPDDRFASARELAETLAAIASGADADTAPRGGTWSRWFRRR